MGIMRVVLAISVVLAHSTPIAGITLLGGRTAVECFFVISGFYMMLVISGKYARLGSRIWPVFITSRLARLYPVYALIAIATVAAGLLSGPSALLDRFSELSPIGALQVGLANITLIGQDLLTFTVVRDGSAQFAADALLSAHRGAGYLVVPQAWSLSIELLFYIVAPWLLRRSTLTLVIVGGASLGVKIAIGAAMLPDPWSYRFFPAELVYFLAGALAFKLLSSHLNGRTRLGPVVLAICLVAFLAYPSASAPEALAVVFPLALACVIPLVFEWSKRSVVDRRIGDLSYPLYLVHLLVQMTLLSFGVRDTGLVLTVVSLAAAAAMVVIVDHPLERLRQRRLDRVTGNQDAVAPATA